MSIKVARPEPTQLDWARLAAFVDGEGSIGVYAHKQFHKRQNRIYYAHFVSVTIVNTDPRLALWLKDTFGGNVGYGERRKENQRPRLNWNMTCQRAVELIRGMYPYLLLKQEQADLVFAFQGTVTRKVGRAGHSQETLRLRQEIAAKLIALKKSPLATREHAN